MAWVDVSFAETLMSSQTSAPSQTSGKTSFQTSASGKGLTSASGKGLSFAETLMSSQTSASGKGSHCGQRRTPSARHQRRTPSLRQGRCIGVQCVRPIQHRHTVTVTPQVSAKISSAEIGQIHDHASRFDVFAVVDVFALYI
jgi:hypothetical protein